MDTILFALWFFLPASIANMAPIFANNIPWIANWKPPLDSGKTYRGKRIFGDHKTYRGLAAGALAGLLVAYLQTYIASKTSFSWINLHPFDYSDVARVLGLGLGMSIGALLGDAVKSFFKRQIGVAPGRNWVPFDQIDFIIGGIIGSLPFVLLNTSTYLVIFIAIGLMHPVTNLAGWILKLKDKPF